MNVSAPLQRAPHHRQGGAVSQETAVMDLWDAGRSKQAISRLLGLRYETVSDIVNIYDGSDEQPRHHRAMIASSARLLGAICAARAQISRAA